MVNLGMFHLLDRARTASFSAAITCLLQQPWVVFSCQTQRATDRQLKVSTLQFATAGGDVYIFDCLALGLQAVHEHGLAWLLQSPHLKKIMYSSDNTAAALWRQLKIQIAGAVDLQTLTTPPQEWPSQSFDSDQACLTATSDSYRPFAPSRKSSLSASAPLLINTPATKHSVPQSHAHAGRTSQTTHHVSVDANSQKSGRRGHESPQAVLDLMLDDLESETLSSPHDIVYEFTKAAPAGRSPSGQWLPPRGRCSSIGSMSLLDSMQLMELPILPGMQSSEHVHNTCFAAAPAWSSCFACSACSMTPAVMIAQRGRPHKCASQAWRHNQFTCLLWPLRRASKQLRMLIMLWLATTQQILEHLPALLHCRLHIGCTQPLPLTLTNCELYCMCGNDEWGHAFEGEDGSVAEEYVEDKLNEGERFNWLARPLASDALDYAAAEAKTILRLYQQVAKDDKYAASIMDSQSSALLPDDMFGPASPNSVYKQQQVERRKLLSAASEKASCPAPVPPKQGGDASHMGSPVARKGKKKSNSWKMPCLS